MVTCCPTSQGCVFETPLLVFKWDFKVNGHTFRESNSAIFSFASNLGGVKLLKNLLP